jgi:hypothetical protein
MTLTAKTDSIEQKIRSATIPLRLPQADKPVCETVRGLRYAARWQENAAAEKTFRSTFSGLGPGKARSSGTKSGRGDLLP